jgi:general secretion pathway protein L
MAVIGPDLMKLDIAALAERAWRWWVDELRGVWDNSVLRNFRREADLPVLTLSANGVLEEPSVMPSRGFAETFGRIPGVAALMGRAALARPVTLQLAPPLFLHTQIDLPAVTSRVLPNLLKFEIERHTPLALSDTCFGYRVLGRDRLTGRMKVDLFVAKLRTVNRAAEAAQDRGHRVARLTALAPDGVPVEMPVFGAQLPAIHLDHHGRVTSFLVIAVAFLIAATAWSYSERQDRLNDALLARLTELQKETDHIDHIKNQRAALERDLDRLKKLKSNDAIAPVLEAIARVLPDDSWLSGVEVNGADVTVTGFSNSAFQLPATFNASGVFGNAHLLGPVQHQTGDPADRFDMAAQYLPALEYKGAKRR